MGKDLHCLTDCCDNRVGQLTDLASVGKTIHKRIIIKIVLLVILNVKFTNKCDMLY